MGSETGICAENAMFRGGASRVPKTVVFGTAYNLGSRVKKPNGFVLFVDDRNGTISAGTKETARISTALLSVL